MIATSRVAFERDRDVARMYTLSPFVWREQDGYHVLLRCVPHSDDPARKISSIFYGRGSNGDHFRIASRPVLAPDTELDSGGCEDPTVCRFENAYHVFYSGWNEELHGGNLLVARGPSLDRLEKHGKALPPNDCFEKCKEATVVRRADGTWLMFFEYSHGGRSRVGTATAPSLRGTWAYGWALFESRFDHWDSWHLSTGPIIVDGAKPVMFYNGADRAGTWRVGWLRFDADYTRVEERCEEPLFTPERISGGFRDVAFASSALREGEQCRLYYTVADAIVHCAIVDLESQGIVSGKTT